MKGQTLIEILVALGIITVVVTALASVVVTSMGNVKFSKNQNQATQYAQEGIEIVRQIRDNSYTTFQGKNGTYCLGSSNVLPPVPSVCNTANVGEFIRKVTVVQNGCDTNVAKVTINVSWQDSKCSAANTYCHTSQLESCLSSVNPNAGL